MAKERVLWTIGHSTRALSDFLKLLVENNVRTIVDVRRFPGSRRYPQFNQEALRSALEIAGYRYVPMAQLGGRRQPAQQSHNLRWRNAAFRGYADYMESADFERAVEELLALAESDRVAIMCSEAVWWRCHRSLIADYLKSKGIHVIHILNPGQTLTHPYTAAARLENGSLTYRPLETERLL